VERLPALNVLDGSAFVLSDRHGDVDAQRHLVATGGVDVVHLCLEGLTQPRVVR